MADTSTYSPPPVWKWDAKNGGKWASTNRPIAGATQEKKLPIGEHPHQLYSLATPNGVKVTVMFEELLALGKTEAEYDAWLIKIGAGEQFGSGFVGINPNSKIPAMMDYSTATPTRVFESASILFYLAEKFDAFIPHDPSARAECMSWVFWQMGSAPYLGGGFGHFYAYAPFKIQYAIDRFAMETKRQLDVLDRQLAENRYIAGDAYTIADMAIWPWYGAITSGNSYANSEVFLEGASYTNVVRWEREVAERPAVKRGRRVNLNGEGKIRERHDASDLDD
jgi:GST-like protein